ncbi:probable magnesium transporter NIPA4 isoform X2 [Euphorbia lathyris]|uniref:probable magnesium transporter NIPA4 isoform X2 n=1 Tax=Euphorbia lathyris TaxID=212925 RepID=UPI00331414B1
MAAIDKGMSVDNIKGLVLALSSSIFIGSSFIVKKKGLKKAGSSGLRAGSGGYSYLYEPLWWIGMITMVVGEIANFAAYAFAPAILVTPLGAVSIIISAALAHVILREKLHIFGILGCALCVVGSTTIVLHAPQEREIHSVAEVWDLATEPAFLFYTAFVMGAVFIFIVRLVPQYGQTHVMVYIAVCSLVGSLSVMSVKALGIALKLTFSGMNQLVYPQTWAFTLVVVTCVVTQMNYLNKALDTFNTAVVSPIYYVMFTSLTILASVIMFKDWSRQNPTQIVTEMCGFVTILSGTFLLHRTKDMSSSPAASPDSSHSTKTPSRNQQENSEEEEYKSARRKSFSWIERGHISRWKSEEKEEKMDMLWEDYFNQDLSTLKKRTTSDDTYININMGCVKLQPPAAAADNLRLSKNGRLQKHRNSGSGFVMFIKVLKKLFLMHNSKSHFVPRNHCPVHGRPPVNLSR